MSAKHGYSGAVFLVLLVGPLIRAQGPVELPFLKPQSDTAQSMQPVEPSFGANPPPVDQPSAVPSPLQTYAPDSWLAQQEPLCCGPLGKHGPIGSELYVRGGPSLLIGSGDFAKALKTGGQFQAGGRSLFYTPDGYRAWIVDLNVGYTYNDGHATRSFLFRPNDIVTIRNLHRTAVGLGLGHDWWCFGPGDVGSFWSPNFRYGLDGGARYGTSHLDLNTTALGGGYERIQKIYGESYAGIHLDMEVPQGAWTFVAGMRAEWSYSFLHLLPGTNSLYSINLLLNMGVRY